MDPVEAAIQAALQLIPARAAAGHWATDAMWTVAVKEALVSVGRSFGWLTAASGCNADQGEWLYDVVWYQSDHANHLSDVPLVAESEWGRGGAVKDDFEKLLVARSKYRVMVFQADSEDEVRELFGKMRIWVAKFHCTRPGDRFLLVGWAKDHWVFELHVA